MSKKQTVSNTDRLAMAEDHNDAALIAAEILMGADTAFDSAALVFNAWHDATAEANQTGRRWGHTVNMLIVDGHAEAKGLNTTEKIAGFFGMSADTLRAQRLTAALAPIMDTLGLGGTDGFYWSREFVKGLKELNGTGDLRLVNPETFCLYADADEATLMKDLPNTVRRLSMMAECLGNGMLEVAAAKAAAEADRGGFETIEAKNAIEAEVAEDAAEEAAIESAKSPMEKALEAIAKASKMVNALEGEERKIAADAGKAAFTKAGLEANA